MNNTELDRLTLTPDLQKYGGGMSFEARQMIDIVRSPRGQAQRLMKHIGWLSANTRDYDYPPGDWLVPEIFASVTDPELLKDLLAGPTAEILDLLPNITDEMVSRGTVSKRDKSFIELLRNGVMINSLAFAAQIRRPDVLQGPLERLFTERIIPPGAGIATQDNRSYLRTAMMANQGDQRFRPIWLGMIKANKDGYLPGDRNEGLAGVLELPPADPVNQFAYDAIAEAGKWFGKIRYKYPHYDSDGAKFNTGFLLPLLYKFKFDEQYWDCFQSAVDETGWSRGKKVKLDAFRRSMPDLRDLVSEATHARREHLRLLDLFGINRDNPGSPDQQRQIRLTTCIELGAVNWIDYILDSSVRTRIDIGKLSGEER